MSLTLQMKFFPVMQTFGRDTHCSKVRYFNSQSVCCDLQFSPLPASKALILTPFPHIKLLLIFAAIIMLITDMMSSLKYKLQPLSCFSTQRLYLKITAGLCVCPGEQFECGGCGADILEEPHPEIYPASFALPPSTSALWRCQHPL